MRKYFLTGLLIVAANFLWAQKIGDIINSKDAERIIGVLASDEMKGRKTFSPEIEKAAELISTEFNSIGLISYQQNGTKSNSSGSYRQEFALIRSKIISITAKLNEQAIEKNNIIVFTCQSYFKIDEGSGYIKAFIKAGANLQKEAKKLIYRNKNMLVLIDKGYANSFGNLARLKSSMFKTNTNVVFVLSDTNPSSYSIEAVHEITEKKMANVVAVLPGKSRKEEYVIFSGHYDHLGIGNSVNGDSIYNGANDNAAGIAAVILLAKYFKALNNNERTLVFVAFTAEEVGGFGSQYFSRTVDADKVMAMINIEMIGTESKWGKNAAYITGYEKSNMGETLISNLKGTEFSFYPDPYPGEQLFYRSDNATLAKLGVPAHTISTAKMDNEPNYHKLTDHAETLDMGNMTSIIKAIALSAKSIVAGKETPTRVKLEE